MLNYNKVETGYQIIETIHGAISSSKKVVEYNNDLSKKKVNSDPWFPTSKSDIDWFHKYYYKHFPYDSCISLHCSECGDELSYGDDGYGTEYGTCQSCIDNYEEE